MHPDIDERIELRLGAILMERNLTPAQFARNINVSKSTINELLKRRTHMPQPRHLIAICDELDIGLSDLVRIIPKAYVPDTEKNAA